MPHAYRIVEAITAILFEIHSYQDSRSKALRTILSFISAVGQFQINTRIQYDNKTGSNK